MASILTEITCPNCTKKALEDYYYKSDEKYIYCLHCGLRRYETFEFNDRGSE